ncbi:MAG: AsnC family transcriptional regulator [Dehalococcoidia bacterium]
MDRRLLERVQQAFPLSPRPFRELGEAVGLREAECLERVQRLQAEGLIRHINALFEGRALGYRNALVALQVPASGVGAAAEVINAHPGVSHNYLREHRYNMWFTIALPAADDVEAVVAEMGRRAGAQSVLFLPTMKMFKLQAINLAGNGGSPTPAPRRRAPSRTGRVELSPRECQAVRALQSDLPLLTRPFLPLAEGVGLGEAELLKMGRGFLERGIMRRYSAQLHHVKMGYAANGMGCWVVPAGRVVAVGRELAKSPRVTHCYQRPTYPGWPYSLFTMVHAPSREECQEVVADLSRRAGVADYTLLFSTRELKKSRVRYFE